MVLFSKVGLAILGAALFAVLTAHASFADTLPSKFLGHWESVPSVGIAVDIFPKLLVWDTENPCGKIDAVKIDGADNVVVTLTCKDDEGSNFHHPVFYKDVQIWRLFEIDGKTFMALTSQKDKLTNIVRFSDDQARR